MAQFKEKSMNIITGSIRYERSFDAIVDTIKEQRERKKPLPMLVTGLCEGARFALYEEVCGELRGAATPMLIIVPDEKEVLRLSSQFRECGAHPAVYPARDFIFYNMTASRDFEHERLSVLASLLPEEKQSYDVIITTPDAALQYTVPPEVLSGSIRTVSENGRCDMGELINFLTRVGYARVELVDGQGQFSVRGGIIDVFPPLAENPIRIDFFDDEIEQIGSFDVLSQRRLERIENAVLTPARELLLKNDDRAKLKTVISSQLKKLSSAHAGADMSDSECEAFRLKNEQARTQLSGEIEALDAGTELGFLDKYITFVYPQKSCLLDYFASDSVIIVQQYNAVSDRIKNFVWHSQETVKSMLNEGIIHPQYAEYNKWDGDFEYFISSHTGIMAELFAVSVGDRKLSGVFDFITKQTVSYGENRELLIEDITMYKKNGYRLVLMCENEAVAKNTVAMLNEEGFAAFSVSAEQENGALQSETAAVLYGCCLSGYELPNSKFACLSLYMNQNIGTTSVKSYNRVKKKKKSSQERILSYADLEIGDYIVHENHGIGQYLGLESLTMDGVVKDFVKIKYDGTDMLYLPCTQLDKVSKYIGARSDDGTLKLSKMGGTEWKKAKTKAKSAAKDMAKELIQLYAERLRREGFAFSKDDEMQREFENAFEYEETDGQLAAIEDIKQDMQLSCPMDRLLCGDVGFGKTEVAMRAAFKAAENSKQVAILVPTTILALQHYQTFLSRMRGFPVQIDMLSRFRTSAQQKETLRRLRRGETDIIVGTHRLLSKDVEFKDLGLLIVDEEQRFGVAHKEKIKQRSGNVDVLTLTATPIPRTLNMAMSGIRDMSILEEAPGDRVPVQTYVCEYDDLIIGEAIQKELRRGGQVLYLHNTIEDIDRTAARVASMAPDAVIATAHGQMDKELLSDIWRGLVAGDIDILICTTIIETGVDLPNANTLIIENADKMGLSQLHQIRGRVGRSSRRAYAYFTYTKGKVLTEIASKRLGAIRDYTEFGSGFKVALRDLEIRGAGNVLGSEQHGHIESVGYDLYMKILNEAILEEKGEIKAPISECTVELDLNAYIPEKYIRSSKQRIDIYKKIALIENEEDMRDVTDELLDRYGDPPKAVLNLLTVAMLRSLGAKNGITKLESKGGSIMIYPEHINVQYWTALAAKHKGRLLVNLGSKPYISCRAKSGEDIMAFTRQLFNEYSELAERLV